ISAGLDDAKEGRTKPLSEIRERLKTERQRGASRDCACVRAGDADCDGEHRQRSEAMSTAKQMDRAARFAAEQFGKDDPLPRPRNRKKAKRDPRRKAKR